MGRMRPAWYYERQAQEAEARAAYYRNRVPPAGDTTIQSRGASTDLFYRSLIQLDGTDHLVYKVSVPNATLTLLPAADAGLATTAGSSTALRLRGSGLKPTKIHWYRGRATAIRRRTAWNTSVAVYYDDQGGRSHYSTPFSQATGIFNPDDLKDKFEALFGPSGTRRNLLGAVNGRAYIEWERVTVSAQS
jgi:hypothetical protein